MLLVGRLWDAFFDPMMGVLADRTNTRWGKFRPWVLWTAVPWAVVMVLAYTVPGFGYAGTIAWVAITNIALMTLYSANNTPYSALSGVMTGDSNERTSLSSYRFVAAMLAQLIVGGFTLPLVAKFGHGNNAVGWRMTMTLWAVVCVVCFVITFATTRERIQPPPQQKTDAWADLTNLFGNGPWIAMFVLTLSHFVFVAMRGGTMFYYFNYYVDQAHLFDFLQRLGLPQATVAQPDGGHYLMNVFGLILACRSLERRVGRVQSVQHREPGDHRRRRHRVDLLGAGDSASAPSRSSGFSLDDDLPGRRSSSFRPARSSATYGLELVRALVVRADDSAHLGDVRRRRRLRRVEDRAPHDGRRVRDDSLRSQDRPEPRRRDRGLAAVGLRLSRQRRRRPSTR